MTKTMEKIEAAPAPATIDADTMFKLVSGGDTSGLSKEQKIAYYRARCEAAGLDPRTAPFQFLRLSGKEVLYAKKEVSEQLSSKHTILVEILDQRTEQDVRTVTVRARAKDGRQTDEIGCVSVAGKKGDDLCNAYMKAVTKAKRRAVLSICGLGMMDETEVETVRGAVVVEELPAGGAPAAAAPAPAPTSPPPAAGTIEIQRVKIASVKKLAHKDGKTFHFDIEDTEGVVVRSEDEALSKFIRDNYAGKEQLLEIHTSGDFLVKAFDAASGEEL